MKKKRNIFKSIGVIILGFAISEILSVLTDFLLESIGVLPDPEEGLFGTANILIALSYRMNYTIFTGFIVAKLSPNKPMLHAMILGGIGTALTLLSLSDPDIAAKSELWFVYTLAALTIPCLWLGVKIYESWKK